MSLSTTLPTRRNRETKYQNDGFIEPKHNLSVVVNRHVGFRHYDRDDHEIH